MCYTVTMAPEFTSEVDLGSLALDFLHTLRRTRQGTVDLVNTPEDLLSWLAAHPEGGLSTELRARVDVPTARSLLSEARRLRADIGALVEAHALGRQPPTLAVHGVQRVLSATRWSWHLQQTPVGPQLVDHAAGDVPICVLGPVALAAARLVTRVDSSRLRACASARCGVWFVDTSKGGRRRWCSMARCGNRAKAAVHRSKERAG